MKLLLRTWHSPTLMTWGSLAARLLGVLVLLPLVLHRFSSPDIVLWLLFGSFVNLQILADAGFSQTFARAIAGVLGGANVASLRDMRRMAPAQIDTADIAHTLARVLGTMRVVYGRLTVISIVLLLVVGFFIFPKPVRASTDMHAAWVAAALVLLATVTSLWGNIYAAYLQGSNKVALFRRWEMLTAIAGTMMAIVVLLLGGHLLAVVASQQIWVVLTVVRNRWLCRQDADFRTGVQRTLDAEVLASVWPGAWRSGMGVFMSYGLIQASGMVYAQLGSGPAVSAYLLALRMVQTISQFSQAPFYSKLPLLARLRAQGLVEEQVRVAKHGMRLANLTFVLGFLAVGCTGAEALRLIHSNSSFVSPGMWTLLGIAFLAERVGAMHIQLYSTTNHIIWHTANGWTGLVMFLMGWFLYRSIGVYAFPVAMGISYIFIYCSISISHSYKGFGLSFKSFDLEATAVPVAGGVMVWILLLTLGLGK